jgi:hypothetical protein
MRAVKEEEQQLLQWTSGSGGQDRAGLLIGICARQHHVNCRSDVPGVGECAGRQRRSWRMMPGQQQRGQQKKTTTTTAGGQGLEDAVSCQVQSPGGGQGALIAQGGGGGRMRH